MGGVRRLPGFPHPAARPRSEPMRYLRSPYLVFWALVVVTLTALLLGAATRGTQALDGGTPPLQEVAAVAPGPASSQAAQSARALMALMPSGVAAGRNAEGLTAWATQVHGLASEGASLREAEGASQTDPMRLTFAAITSHAERLVQSAADPVAAASLRTQIGLHTENLGRLLAGLPAPALPDTGLDPFGNPTPSQPSAGDPGDPDTPDTPAGSGTGVPGYPTPNPPTPARPATPALPAIPEVTP